MSLEVRMRSYKAVLALGTLLVAWLGLALLGGTWQHAWGWRNGEPVTVKIGEHCEYKAKSGRLVDCAGSWTTKDGTTHEGQIEGQLSKVNEPPGSTRAYGDTAYTKPTRWMNFWGFGSPIAGGFGLLLLLLGWGLRPSKAKRTEARSRPMPEVASLARSRDLGGERARYWMEDSVTYGVFTFEHGFVSHLPEGSVAYRWDEVLGVFERFVRRGRKVEREYVVWPGGEEFLTLQERDLEDITGLGAVLTESVAQHLRPKILAALQRGESYLFPRWGEAPFTEFTTEGVGGDDGMIPWSELAGADVQNGQIVIYGRQSLVRSWSDTGNPGLLVTLLRDLAANRPGIGATNS